MGIDDPFVATPKVLAEPLRWPARHGTAAAVSQVPLEHNGLIVGDVIVIVLAAQARHWTFKLRTSGRELLRWDYLPVGSLRRHRNGNTAPPGFPPLDRSLEHEHPWVDGEYHRYSRPLATEHDTLDHAEAFAFFCERSNTDPGDHYREPPVFQLPMEPS